VRVTKFWEVTVGLMSRSCQEGSFEWLHKNDLEFKSIHHVIKVSQ
jgi:hypothetical protein